MVPTVMLPEPAGVAIGAPSTPQQDSRGHRETVRQSEGLNITGCCRELAGTGKESHGPPSNQVPVPEDDSSTPPTSSGLTSITLAQCQALHFTVKWKSKRSDVAPLFLRHPITYSTLRSS